MSPAATLPLDLLLATANRPRAWSRRVRLLLLLLPPHCGLGRLEPILSLFPRLAARRVLRGSRLRASLRDRVQTRLEARPRLQISAPRFSSREWRADAWDRERNREQRDGKTDSSVTNRRRSGS